MKKNLPKKIGLKKLQKIAIALALAAILIIGGSLLWLKVQDDRRKFEARSVAENIIDTLKLDGELVGSGLGDTKCSSQDASMFLGSIKTCGHEAYIFFKNNKNLSYDLHSIDSQLQQAGWSRRIAYGSSNKYFEERLHGGDGGGVRIYNKAEAYLELHYFGPVKDSTRGTLEGGSLRGLLREKDISLTDNEYVYGVYLFAKYRENRYPL